VKVLVLLKQVPRLRSDTPFNDDGTWLDLEKTKFDANSYDLFALEAALQLVEASGDDGEVVVASAGPKRVVEALKSALEIGAHRAIHLIGDGYEALDAGALARVFAVVCEREQPDLVVSGFMSDDGNAAALGPMLAEAADIPSATGIVTIEATVDGFRVERELEAGAFEVVDLGRPALVTVHSGINEVRYPSLKAIVAARKKKIDVIEPGDLGSDAPPANSAIQSIASAGNEGAAELLEGTVEEVVDGLIAKLDELRVL
jgi:electron transfer flavoprotein beta subunit